MRLQSLALALWFLLAAGPAELLKGQTSPPSGGHFVKPPVEMDFKEALAFPEISLMLRSGLSEAEITQEIRERGLVSPIAGEEAKSLQEKGASPTLLATLQNLQFVLTPAEYDKYLQRKAKKQAGTGVSAQPPPPIQSWRPFLRQAPKATAPAAPVRAPQFPPKATEIEVPLDEFTVIAVNGHDFHIGIHDNGDDSISVKVEKQRPARFPKADGFDSQNNNLTPLFSTGGYKVSFVNTPRAHMNKCILRIEPVGGL